MIVRGGKMISVGKPDTTNRLLIGNDYARMATLEARWKSSGVSVRDYESLIPCAIWISKFPGTQYSEDIMKRLEELRCGN